MNRRLIILGGVLLGVLGVLLVRFGNPLNMGVCVACFVRDIAGGLGLHRAAPVQYIRPEIPGFLLGAFLAALATGEIKARGGSSPVIRFFMGTAIMIGALIFLGCPLRMVLRLAAGDLNAIIGLLGFTFGIITGIFFLRRGFTLGRAYKLSQGNSTAMPLIAVGLLVLVAAAPVYIFFSESGPGAMKAPFLISLAAGLLIGVVVQRTRLCMAGGIRDIVLIRDAHLFYGSLAILLSALVINLATGNFNPAFTGQPIAHTNGLWNFIGLAVVGLGATLLGGCPLRQTVMAGEGDTDAALVFLGMLVGAAFAHNFGLAASPAGVSAAGQWAGGLAVFFLLSVGFGFTLPQASMSVKGGISHER